MHLLWVIYEFSPDPQMEAKTFSWDILAYIYNIYKTMDQVLK